MEKKKKKTEEDKARTYFIGYDGPVSKCSEN